MRTLFIDKFFLKWDLCPWAGGWTYWTFTCISDEDNEIVSEFYSQSVKYEIT